MIIADRAEGLELASVAEAQCLLTPQTTNTWIHEQVLPPCPALF